MIVMLDKNNYQNNIKQFRVREGLTQEELAKKINTSRQMIGLIENNKTNLVFLFFNDEMHTKQAQILQ